MRITAGIAIAGLLLQAGCSSGGKSAADRAALQGEWEVVSGESNGGPAPPGMLDDAKLIVLGDQAILLGKEATFRLDAAPDPRHIDFVRGDNIQLAIYELKDDTLRLCVGTTDDRPAAFRTEPGTSHTLFVLKRKR
jgi:uncharacterized protein (TIGR03067 family)